MARDSKLRVALGVDDVGDALVCFLVGVLGVDHALGVGPRFFKWYLNLNLNFNGITVYDFYIGELFLC